MRSAFSGLLGARRGLRGLSPADYADLRGRAQFDDDDLAVLQDYIMSEGKAETREEATAVAFPLLAPASLARMVTSYVGAVLTYEDCDDTDEGMTLDDDGYPRRVTCGDIYDLSDFSGTAIVEMQSDCESFVRRNYDEIEQAMEEVPGYSMLQLGRDFYHTRQRDGAGFSDHGGAPPWTLLRDAAKSEGEFYVYVGKSGKLEIQ